DRSHNPEFTILEFYVAYKDYLWMMETTEQLLSTVAEKVNGTTKVDVNGKEVNFEAPYKRISIYDAIEEYTGYDLKDKEESAIREVCEKLDMEVPENIGKGKLIDEIFGEKCEARFIQPTFIIDYPVEMSPLT